MVAAAWDKWLEIAILDYSMTLHHWRKPFLSMGLCKASNGILENDVSNSKQVPKSNGGKETLLMVEEL